MMLIEKYIPEIQQEFSKDINLITQLRTIKYTPQSFEELKKYQHFYMKVNDNNLPYELEEYSKSLMLLNYFKLLFSYLSHVLISFLNVIKSILDPNKLINSITNVQLDMDEINRLSMNINQSDYRLGIIQM